MGSLHFSNEAKVSKRTKRSPTELRYILSPRVKFDYSEKNLTNLPILNNIISIFVLGIIAIVEISGSQNK